jgi:hypothetical protein
MAVLGEDGVEATFVIGIIARKTEGGNETITHQ